MIPHSDITYIESNARIEQLIDEPMRNSNGHLVCCCPFHEEKTPSFHIYPDGHYFCFGCHERGRAISFVMRREGLTFVEATRKLAKMLNYQLHETEDKEKTHEEVEADNKRQEMLEAYSKVQRFFEEQLYADCEESKVALTYAKKRWKKAYLKEVGIGYAPDSYNALRNFAKKEYIREEILLELGLLKRGDKGNVYDFFRARLMIPIRNVSHMVIGYTARHIEECYNMHEHKKEETPGKYLNPTDSLVYEKKESLFGIDIALPQASKENLFYLVEGAPDVLRLHSIGVYNAVAALGCHWTDAHIEQLARRAHKVCIIPDIDPKDGNDWGTGIREAIKTGERLIAKGFDEVLIKIIPSKDPKKKIDADDYFTTKAKFDGVASKNFIVWYAEQLAADPEKRLESITTIARLISHYPNPVKVDVLVEDVRKYLKGTKASWTEAISTARKGRAVDTLRKKTSYYDADMLDKYGFQESENTYVAVTGQGKRQAWSNFILHPLFHIKDPINSSRIFEIINNRGAREIIELKADDLVSISRFKLKVESLGNFLWEAKEEQLTRLKRYLYEATETASLITQLGWQRQGFFAFGNGIFDGKEWIPADDNGIARIKLDGNKTSNYYFPGASRIYKNDAMLYQFERRFVHRTNESAFTLYEYAEKLVFAFGENGQVSIAFMIATLFRDIIVRRTKMFPLLNIFGPKGSGKSELGHSMMAFFIRENTPPNLQTSTIAALADAVAQCSNATVHFDEYKNTLDISKIEFLKGIWDGAGRNRMNMDRDKKREVTQVDSAIILTGQEMPSADNALFSRLIYLTTTAADVERTDAETQCFKALVEMRKSGCTHLTQEILRYRSQMEAGFAESWDIATAEFCECLNGRTLETRIFNNWLVPLAAFRTLQHHLRLPFSYETLLTVCTRKAIEQNDEAKSNDEKFNFWDMLAVLKANGDIYDTCDFKVEWHDKLSLFKEEPLRFDKEKRILYLRFNIVYSRCERYARMLGKTIVPKGTLLHDLRSARDGSYLGLSATTRFNVIIKGQQIYQEHTPIGQGPTKKSETSQAHCFDYTVLQKKYNLNLYPEYDEHPDETSQG